MWRTKDEELEESKGYPTNLTKQRGRLVLGENEFCNFEER